MSFISHVYLHLVFYKYLYKKYIYCAKIYIKIHKSFKKYIITEPV